MLRFALLLTSGVLAFASAPAFAQEDETLTPVPTPIPCPTLGPGQTDADYQYCGEPCQGTDADYQYAYCTDAIPSGTGPKQRKAQEPGAAVLPAAALPLTGSETWLIGLAGLGLLLAGSGLRLRNAAVPTR